MNPLQLKLSSYRIQFDLIFFFPNIHRLTLHKYWLIIIIFLILKVGRAWSRVQGFVM